MARRCGYARPLWLPRFVVGCRPAVCATLMLMVVMGDPAAGRVAGPEITLAYEGLFEAYCADLAGVSREPEVEAELKLRLPEFQAAWRAEQSQLLDVVVELTGKPFAFANLEATLHLCRNAASMSTPLLIAVRPHMRAAMGTNTRPLALFTNTLFHEVLHRYLRHARPPTTPLIAKYKAEPWPVRNHLHLFALEELAYRRLGRSAELPLFVADDRHNAVLSRARAIVAAEGAAGFLAELRQPSPANGHRVAD